MGTTEPAGIGEGREPYVAGAGAEDGAAVPPGRVDPLFDLVRAALRRRAAGTTWDIAFGDFWCGLRPPGHRMRRQGWKLHVSATPLSAPIVLARAADILVAHGCSFKFARDLDRVEQSVSARYDRAAAGKFLTVYPYDDEQLKLLADALHRATEGLPGPGILSDRCWLPGSLVHYRYGAFAGVEVLTHDGGREVRLTAPDGTLVEDRRLPRFSPPSWAEPLWPGRTSGDGPREDTASGERPARPGPVLLAGRFAVREAIRHATKGGVFRATDTRTGGQVVIKQARPGTGATLAGTDARTMLRREADLLRTVEPTGVAPGVVAFFEQDENAFLVQELVPGVKLRDWVTERLAPAGDGDADGEAAGGWGTPPEQAVRLAGDLAGLLAAVHATGLVFRDFTPNNVMVTPDGSLRLVDFEFAARPGDRVVRAFTHGYAPAEQVEAPRFGPAPPPATDLYALGATVLFVATGMDPVLAEDDPTAPAGRTRHTRLAGLVRATGLRNPAVRRVAPLVLGLTADDPRARWDLTRVREFLRDGAPAGPVAVRSVPPAPGTGVRTAITGGRRAPGGEPSPPDDVRLPAADAYGGPTTACLDRLVDDGLEHILRTLRTDGRDRLWPSGRFGETTDPCNVQHGASGVLSVLVRAAAHRPGDERLREAAGTVARWIADRVHARTAPLPGLYFGGAGPAWALLDAALLLDDAPLRDRAYELAGRLPLRWPNPDVCHGAAGSGMTQLRMWRASGDALFADRARTCADGLLAAARPGEHGPLWPVPDSFDSDLAGLVHYGFAHGVAGVAAFLLDAGLALDDDRYLAAARDAGRTLAAAVQDEHGGALWPDGPGATGRPRTHWCSGSSGVGTFLIRLWRHTGDPLHRTLAERAALAVRRATWRSPSALCHGLAGDGEFLLDLGDALDDPRHRAWAGELAHALRLRAVVREGLLLVPDESGIDVTCDQGTGLAGPVGFLLRLSRGGPRPWTTGTARTGTARTGTARTGTAQGR